MSQPPSNCSLLSGLFIALSLLHYLICKTPEKLGSLINVVNFETEVRPFSEIKTPKFNTYYYMAAIILAYDKIW